MHIDGPPHLLTLEEIQREHPLDFHGEHDVRCGRCLTPFPCLAASERYRLLALSWGAGEIAPQTLSPEFDWPGFTRFLRQQWVDENVVGEQVTGAVNRGIEVRWRCWSVHADRRIRGRLYPVVLGGMEPPVSGRETLVRSRRVPASHCWSDPEHVPPVPGCSCGWRSMPSLREAAEYCLGHPLAGLSSWVFTPVRTTGLVLDGNPRDDPDHVVRSGGLVFAGKMLLSPQAAHLERPLQQAFRYGVQRSAGSQKGWLRELASNSV